ncbi:hypothetical protein NWF32_30445, partial [Pseudomonas qingdaonensis]|nr:hypothetical protein [Pseudomonas qingdaonensis]
MRTVMRALLLLLACVSLPSLADLDYHLAPRQIAADTCSWRGQHRALSRTNGGNIVNTGFIVTEAGVAGG